jgi:RNA polymerase sigma factor (sigma-70 family)
MSDTRQAFVERLFAEHRRALQSYFYRRIRTKCDAADLAQEVYVRMLRVNDADAIRNPQVYLFAVANNLVKEHAILNRRWGIRVEVEAANDERRLGEAPPLDFEVDAKQLSERLRAVIERLPVKWRTAIILQYRYGLTYQQIGDQLGVSANMVKKYLAQGLAQCRRRMARWE